MRVELVQPFVTAAATVLEAEFGDRVRRDTLRLGVPRYELGDVTVMLGVTGDVDGTVLYSLSRDAALAMVGAMVGETVTALDEVGLSAVGELANMITGRAAILLEENGFRCKITPPSVLTSRKACFQPVRGEMLIVPLLTRFGALEIGLALTLADGRTGQG